MSDAHKNEFARIIKFLVKYHDADECGTHLYITFRYGKKVWIYNTDKDEYSIKITSENFAGGSIYLHCSGNATFMKHSNTVWKSQYPASLLRLITPHNHLNPTTWNRIFERVK